MGSQDTWGPQCGTKLIVLACPAIVWYGKIAPNQTGLVVGLGVGLLAEMAVSARDDADLRALAQELDERHTFLTAQRQDVLQDAAGHLSRAVARDPAFALAHATLAMVAMDIHFHFDPQRTWLRQAEDHWRSLPVRSTERATSARLVLPSTTRPMPSRLLSALSETTEPGASWRVTIISSRWR